MSAHAAAFENFNKEAGEKGEEDGEEEATYLTITDIPPPVPPRNMAD